MVASSVLGAATAGALVLLVSGGCKRQEAAKDGAAPVTHVVKYTARGRVAALPSAMGDLSIQHEAIPEFRNPDGSLGMDTMQMPFPLGEGLVLATSIEPGDPVEFTFAVEYSADYKNLTRYFLTAIEELSPETVLDFSPLERQPAAE